MALKLMYITNRPEVARIAEEAGVERIFVDLEYMGKSGRQKGLDTVQSRHTVEDIAGIRKAVRRSAVMVRVNPVHEAGEGHGSSREEIEAAIAAGADILMLPYFKTVKEAGVFLELAGGRARTLLLVETPEAAEAADEVLRLPGVDEIFIGLNDLSIGYGKRFLFELLADGTVEGLCRKAEAAGIPYGFGGIAAPGGGLLPSEYIIREHYRLGSTCAILSRSFCDAGRTMDMGEVRRIFRDGVREIRELEAECGRHGRGSRYFAENHKAVIEKVEMIRGRLG